MKANSCIKGNMRRSVDSACFLSSAFFPNSLDLYQSKKEDKDQESILSSTTPDPGYQWESDNVTTRQHTRALSQQVTTRHQQTDVHESITKQDRNNINDPQNKHRLGTVSKYLTEGA